MPFPAFNPRRPTTLFSANRSTTSSSNNTHQDQEPPSIQDLTSFPWHMIASSSSMWQDHKHSLTITYSLVNSTEPNEFTDLTSWYTQGTNKQTSTKGVCKPGEEEGGFVFQWRGAGWLRWVSTKWEIVGVGLWPFKSEGSDNVEGEWRSGNEKDVVVLVTFVPKTMFSPPALSIFLQKERLDGKQEDSITRDIAAALNQMGIDSLSAEAQNLKEIPRG